MRIVNKHIQRIIHYSAGRMFNNVILVIFLPIFSHYMIPEEYAIYTNITIFIAFAGIFYSVGLNQSMVSYFYKEKTDDYRYTLINSVYLVTSIVGVVLSILIYLFRNFLALLILRSDTYTILFPVIVIIIFAQSISGVTLSIINKLERSINYAVLGGISNFLLLILFAYGSLTGRFSISNVVNYLLISAIISMIVAILNMIIILKSLKPKSKNIYSYDIIKPVVRFGLIMIPGTLALISMRMLDRYMLTYFSPGGMYDVGIYAMGYKVGSIMQFLLSIVSMALFPHAMKNSDDPGAPKLFNKIYIFFLISGAFLGFFIIAFSKELFVIFVDPVYSSAAGLVFFGVISTFLHGVFNIFNLVFYKMHQASKIAVAVILGTVLNVILNIILIPKFGVFGAGYASITAYLFIVLYNYTIGRIVFNVNFRISYVFIVTAFLFIITFISSVIEIDLKVSVIKLTTIISVLFVLLLTQKHKIISLLAQFRNKG